MHLLGAECPLTPPQAHTRVERGRYGGRLGGGFGSVWRGRRPAGGSVAGSWSYTIADCESVDHLGVVADKGGEEVGEKEVEGELLF